MMKTLLPLMFALIAAIGNALFALAQRRSSGSCNGLVFVACSVCLAMMLALLAAPLFGPVDLPGLLRLQGRNVLLAGLGLFLCYVGFNLMYSGYGVSAYILYAVLSILTTTVVVGMIYLREPVNPMRIVSIALAIASVVLYSISQAAKG
jgi:drug/metabolite transporter (DMT)-like permease